MSTRSAAFEGPIQGPAPHPHPETSCGADGQLGPALCQLQTMPPATRPLRLDEKVMGNVNKRVRWVRHILRRLVDDPLVPARKAWAAVGLARRVSAQDQLQAAPSAPASRATQARPLAAGDVVRVRSLAEIRSTLDADGCCNGLSYLPVVMDRYATGTFTVRKRIDRFFDERRWKMLKVRDVVILDGVYCELAKDAHQAWAGCDRSCFLFWKEAWLDRATESAEGS